MPQLQISLRTPLYLSPLNISGGAYEGVPHGVSNNESISSLVVDKPKSDIHIRLFLSNNKFSGFKSR